MSTFDQLTELPKPLLQEAIFHCRKKSTHFRKKPKLFSDECDPFNLKIVFIDIPPKVHQSLTLSLPHCPYGESPSVCVILPDDEDIFNQRKQRVKYPKDWTAFEEVWTNSITLKNITFMPLWRLETEFKEYEAKRKLGKSFDLFVIDAAIWKHAIALLGCKVAGKHKPIIMGKMSTAKDRQGVLERCLKTVRVPIDGGDVNYTVRIGKSDLSNEQLAENIAAVWPAIRDYTKGNLRSLAVGFKNQPEIPILVNLQKNSEVEKRSNTAATLSGKEYKEMKDELYGSEPEFSGDSSDEMEEDNNNDNDSS